MSLGTASTPTNPGNGPGTSGMTGFNRTPPNSAPQMPNPNAYLMPTSPAKNGRASDGYRPAVKKATGQIPACLVNASVTYCGNNQVYAFGGFDQYTDEVYNHVRRLDLKTLKWTVVDNYGDIPGVRMGHTATLYQNDKLIVFGGENERSQYLSDVVILDLNTSTWNSPEIRGPIPRGRARHAAVVYEDKLFIVGGMTTGITADTNFIFDDICYLDLKTWTWSRTWTFVARFDHTAWVWGDRLWVFGGLGIDMERGTDLWWLDLKGSASFMGSSSVSQGSVGSPANANTMTYSPDIQFSASSQIAGPPGGYAPNTGSVQVRSGKRRPNAPGAVSSLKFYCGPYTPSLLSGTHFHVFTSGSLFDLVTPSETVRPWECNLSSLDLDSLRWQRLADGPEIFKSGYRWHYCTVNENGTKAWLFGCNLNASNVPGMGDENNLSEILPINLERYGILGNDLQGYAAPDSRRAPQLSSLGAELAAVFDQSPDLGSGTDFVITADCDDNGYYSEDESALTSSSQSSPMFVAPDAATSAPIHVHRIILQARWPHFKRLYAAQMAEYHTNKMHIPEPYRVVRAFLYYLYTDSITCHADFCPDITDIAGMLVMANLYDMPRLRQLCVHRLSRELAVENAAVIWERAGRTNEEWLKRRAAAFCMANWGRIVRTDGFRTLSRQSLVELCEVVDTEGRVIGGHEWELVGGWGSDRFDPSADTKRAHVHLVADGDDIDGDDDDGMELS